MKLGCWILLSGPTIRNNCILVVCVLYISTSSYIARHKLIVLLHKQHNSLWLALRNCHLLNVADISIFQKQDASLWYMRCFNVTVVKSQRQDITSWVRLLFQRCLQLCFPARQRVCCSQTSGKTATWSRRSSVPTLRLTGLHFTSH